MLVYVDEAALNGAVAELRALAVMLPSSGATLLSGCVARLGVSLRKLSDEEALEYMAARSGAPRAPEAAANAGGGSESASVRAMRESGAFEVAAGDAR